tara:strand:+ start:659 stop:814 length:156 start_codon:yes stop_codon:yes gene_type:complete
MSLTILPTRTEDDILVDLIKIGNKISAAKIERNRIIDELVNLNITKKKESI